MSRIAGATLLAAFLGLALSGTAGPAGTSRLAAGLPAWLTTLVADAASSDAGGIMDPDGGNGAQGDEGSIMDPDG